MTIRETFDESKSQDRFYQDLLRYIRERNLIEAGEKILVAASGGLDSTVLLHALYRIARLLDIRIEVAHVDHRTRGIASENEGTWVRVLCERLHIPYHSLALPAPLERPSQAAFRQARRRLLQAKAESIGSRSIALAHHATDNVETLLMRMTAGTGIHGLGSIRPREGIYFRPLLWATRMDLVGYAQRHQLSWIEDPTNQELNYLRNRMRAELLPLCEDIREGSLRNLARLAQRMGDEEEEFEAWIQQQFEGPRHILPISLYERWPKALQRRIFRTWVEGLGIVGDAQLIEALLRGQERVHPAGSFLKRSDSWIYFEERDFGESWRDGLEISISKRVNLGGSVAWTYLSPSEAPATSSFRLALLAAFKSPVQVFQTGRKAFSLEIAWEKSPWPLGLRPLHQVEKIHQARAHELLRRYRIPEGYWKNWPLLVGLEDLQVCVGVCGLEIFEEFRPKLLERRISIEHLLEVELKADAP